jgi:hypothetical protein
MIGPVSFFFDRVRGEVTGCWEAKAGNLICGLSGELVGWIWLDALKEVDGELKLSEPESGGNEFLSQISVSVVITVL